MEVAVSLIERLNHFIWASGIPVGNETIPFIVLALLGTGFFLTLRLGFVQLRRFGHGVAVASGRWDDPEHPGDVSHFQALSTALSATVGIGNIAGVAIAIHFGGPGALFWMWVTAFLGMAIKFAEVTLAQKYRIVLPPLDGRVGESVSGGPMYYIERGLGRGYRPLAIGFAIALGVSALLIGNGVQANTLADTIEASFGTSAWLTGLVSAVVVGAVILGGIQRIGKVTAVLAPTMAAIYVLGGLLVIVLQPGEFPAAFARIVREAFEPSAGVAGTGVGSVLVTMMWGVRRGLFSNEAGQGSAPIAHAAARTHEPVSEGVVALLEPFIDTLVVCTITALVIVMTNAHEARLPTRLDVAAPDVGWVGDELPREVEVREGRLPEGVQMTWHGAPIEQVFTDAELQQPLTGTIERRPFRAKAADDEPSPLYAAVPENGAPLTMLAFERGLAPLFPGGRYVVLLSVVLFAVSTAISWSYYGDRCAQYVFGPVAVRAYRAIFVLMHFLGAVVPLQLAWTIGDIFLGIVILPNLFALLLLSPQVAEMLRSYFERKPWLQQKRYG